MAYVLWPSVSGFGGGFFAFLCVGRSGGYGRVAAFSEHGSGKEVLAPCSLEGKLQC